MATAIPAIAKAKYASIIVDADSLEILHARKIDDQRFPASLTKMMTLYLTFDALERGELSLREPLPISARAARTPAVRLGLKTGETISVEHAILALSVRSANDASVVLAERLAGSVDEFARQMTTKAHALGMGATVFKNPHGLPNTEQVTTARDMAKLAQALLQNHGKYYTYFLQTDFTYQGRNYKNRNSLLGKVDGVDGFKTGFTNASGYNLVLSAKREGRRIIAVVLGGASGTSRDAHMADLIERGFRVVRQENAQLYHPSLGLSADTSTVTSKRISEPLLKRSQDYLMLASHKTTMRATPRVDWGVQIGAFTHPNTAQNMAQNIQANKQLGIIGANIQVNPVRRNGSVIYRARLIGLSHQKAMFVCKTLAQAERSCLVVAPS